MRKLIAAALLAMLAIFLLQPAMIMDAAKDGIETWLYVVLPTLLPFFILNHLISAYGAIEGLARMCHRATSFLFRLPGEGAFVLAVGYTSGAPVSSTLVADLYRRGTVNREQAYRLLAASANASPLFLFSVVAASFLLRPDLGPTIALVHYGSNLLLAFMWARLAPKCAPASQSSKKERPTVYFGEALTGAVAKSLSAVGLVGGLMVFFFVLIAVFDFCRIDTAFSTILSLFSVDSDLADAIFYGIWEITAGAKNTSEITLGLRLQLAVMSAVLAFGGLSVHSQTPHKFGKPTLKSAAIHFTRRFRPPWPFYGCIACPLRNGFLPSRRCRQRLPLGAYYILPISSCCRSPLS